MFEYCLPASLLADQASGRRRRVPTLPIGNLLGRLFSSAEAAISTAAVGFLKGIVRLFDWR